MAILINQGLPLARRGGEEFKYAEYGLPVLELTGDTSAMTKENPVTLAYKYKDMAGTCEVKWQGSSSLMWPKKNYTIKFDNAFEAKEGWGEQKKYCLKANFIDHSHARNVVSAKLWGEIVKSRTPRGGITGAISCSNGADYMKSAVSVSNGEVTVKTHVGSSGFIFFTGNTYPAGEHTISFDVYNPGSAENNGAFAVLTFGVVGVEDTDWDTVNVNTVEAYGTWLSRTYTVTFPKDNSMIGLIPYSFKATETMFGYIFRNIKVDGVPYQTEPALPRYAEFPNGGAIDGFPTIVTMNGKFHGLYTFNIPKDGWMFGMGEGANEAILCPNQASSPACGFKGEANLVDDFDLEYVTNEDDSGWVLESLNRAIAACMNSDGSDIDTTVAKYIDIDSAIDYYIFCVLLRGNDMVRKNYLLATYDGTKWFFSAYDMDTTYGIEWHGKNFNSALGYPIITDYNHKVMELLRTYKKDEVKARYAALRKAAMSEDNVDTAFLNFGAGVPSAVLAEDTKKWPTIPSSSVSNTAQILQWYRRRIEAIDKDIENL